MRPAVSPWFLAFLWLSPAAAQDLANARYFPPTTVVYAELADPSGLVSTLVDHPLREQIESLPPYQTALRTPAYRRFQMGRMLLEGKFGMPWRKAVDSFAGNGACLGVDPATQGIAVIVQGKDAASMESLRKNLVELITANRGADALKSVEYRGVRAYDTGKVKFAIQGDRILLTNQGELGRQIVDRMIDQGGESLADNEAFQVADAAKSEEASSWAFVDIARIRALNLAEPLYRNPIDNPVAELLLGGIQSVLQATPHASAEVSVKTDGVGLQVQMPFQADWLPEHREYYFGPEAAGQGPAIPQLDETLFTLSTYRDVSQVWLRAGDLFGEKTNDGLAKADANLTTLFAGRDFGEDILGSIEPQIGVIVTRQDFQEGLPRPIIKLPAFAFSLTLRDPATMSGELRRIFQSLVGFLNVVGAMEGRNQLELGMEQLDGDGQLFSSTFVPEEDERESTEAGLIYSFSPSVAFQGDRFVIASTKQLARQLIESPSQDRTATPANTAATLQADVLRSVLNDNREQLIAQNMLEDGNSRQEAEAIIDLVLEVVGYFQDASFRLGIDDGQLGLQLHIRLDQ